MKLPLAYELLTSSVSSSKLWKTMLNTETHCGWNKASEQCQVYRGGSGIMNNDEKLKRMMNNGVVAFRNNK